ncbi:MAG: aldehyde ferredoxin oxidoreductase N-terminal domain-containing protein, partial [Pseudothermotoga sp.]
MILRVNLSTRTVTREEIDEKTLDDFLGARGLATKIIWDEVKGVDPLSSENKLVV